VVPTSEKEPESWSATEHFKLGLGIAGLNATELGDYCRERGQYSAKVESWHQGAQDANEMLWVCPDFLDRCQGITGESVRVLMNCCP